MTRSGFRPAASADIEAAYEWYEAQRPGLGDEFIGAVDAAVASILAFADAYPVVHRDARRVLLERFPYGLYYRVEGRGLLLSLACTLPAIQGGGVRASMANTRVNPPVRSVASVALPRGKCGRPAGYAPCNTGRC